MAPDQQLRLDAHTHVYSADTETYPPIAGAVAPPQGTGFLKRLVALGSEAGMRGFVLIQPMSYYGFDNSYLLSVARTSLRVALVCAFNPEDPSSVPRLLELANEDFPLGLRSTPMRWGQLDHPTIDRLWAAAAEAAIPVNVLVGSENVEGLERLLARHPTLPVVLEHSLCLHEARDREGTLRKLLRVSRFSNAYAEICDLPLLSAEPYPFADAHSIYLAIIRAFGAERCLWGSSFPTELWAPRATYRETLDAVTSLPLPENERSRVLGGTAFDLWFGPSR
jgi:predicted TIM-barrel fold metal-dependent hydrolase